MLFGKEPAVPQQPRDKRLSAMLGGVVWPVIWGGAACFSFYAVLLRGPVDFPLVRRYFAGHPVAFAAAALFFVGVAALILKLTEVLQQLSSLGQTVLDDPPQGGNQVGDCGALLQQLKRLPAVMREGYLAQRLRRVLTNVQRKGDSDGLGDELKYQADVDADRQHESYALVSLVIWATPMLGFLGTVIGITRALGDLDFQIAGSMESAMDGLLSGLYVAFDTTALALSLSILLMVFRFVVERLESQLMARVDARAEEELVGRFQEVGGARDPHVASIEQMSQAVVASSERLVERQAELWQATIDAAHQHWSQLSGASSVQLQESLTPGPQRRSGAARQAAGRPPVNRRRKRSSALAGIGWPNRAVRRAAGPPASLAAAAERAAATSRRGCWRSHAARSGPGRKPQRAVGRRALRRDGDESFGCDPSAQYSAGRRRPTRHDEPRRAEFRTEEPPRGRREWTGGMRRRRRPRGETHVSLFPFLAVLICTMGSLIVLLVLVVEQARAYASSAAARPEHPGTLRQSAASEAAAQARRARAAQQQAAQEKAAQEKAAQEKAAQEREEQLAARDEHLWRAGILQQARQEKAATLQNARLELSHLEAHIRKLESRLEDLQRLLGQTALPSSPDAERARLHAEQLRTQLGQLEERAAVKRRELEDREPEFAIIPYQGPNGTRRRPIYIECTARGVIIQPEGIVLRPSDFEGPMGPGNPLDASVRAIREHWQRAGVLNDSEPYPLLLVRPDGVFAYAKARAALNSWDDEFGYELVGANMPLAFPFDADPQLEQTLESTISVSRQRQVMLARAMPRMFRGTAAEGLAGDTLFPAVEGSSLRDKLRQLNRSQGLGGAAGDQHGGAWSGASSARGDAPYRPPLTGVRDRTVSPSGSEAPAAGQAGAAASTRAGSDAFGGGSSGLGGPQRSHHQSGAGPYSQQLADEGIPPAAGFGDPATGGSATGGSATGGSTRGGLTRGGSTRGGSSGAASPGQAGGGTAGQGAGQAGGAASGAAPGAGGVQINFGEASSGASGNGSGHDVSLADSRGAGWALPKRREAAMAYKRPVKLLCLADRLVVVRERGDDRPSQTVMTPGPVSRHADALVEQVRRHVARWGVAPSGGYWAPMLQVQVGAGAESRFRQLQAALRHSGYDVRRTQ